MKALRSGVMQSCTGYSCVVEDSEKKQVAFIWDGIFDSWDGICHDPTGTVLNSNIPKRVGGSRDDSDYLIAAKMFHGRLVSAEHLWDDWYYCRFA